MVSPSKYKRGYSFAGFQAGSPSKPLPGPRVDDELESVEKSIGGLIDALKDIRGSDGKLQNSIVGPDSLASSFEMGFTMRGPWAAGENYTSADGVHHEGALYAARSKHTSVTGQTPDVTPDLWRFLLNVADITIPNGAIDLGKLSDALKRGEPVQWASRAAVAASVIPSIIQFLRTAGYATVGDGGGALYKRVSSEPAHPGKIQSSDGAWWELAEPVADIRMFGGSVDSPSNNEAFAAAKAFAGAGGTIRFPGRSGDAYAFTGLYDLSGVLLDFDDGVSITGTPALQPSQKVLVPKRPTDFEYDTSTLKFKFRLPADYGKHPGDYQPGLPHTAIDATTVRDVNMSLLLPYRVTFGDDLLSSDQGTSRTATSCSWSVVNDNQIRFATRPVNGGDDLSYAFSAYTSGQYLCAVVLTNDGYQLVFVTAAGGTGAYGIKTQGATLQTAMLPLPYAQENFAYEAHRSMWTIRIYNNRQWALLLNGVEVGPVYNTSADIIEAGPGTIYHTSAGTVTVSHMSLTRRRIARGKRPQKILVLGDSRAAPGTGAWPEYLREYFDGPWGRVESVTNYAVNGHGLTNQLQKLQANGIPSGTTSVLIDIGTNDMQGGANSNPASVSQSIYKEILDICANHGLTVVASVPYLWYDGGPGLPAGQGFKNAANGATWRAWVTRYLASRGVKVIDLQQIVGPVLPSRVTNPMLDDVVYDHGHPTARTQRLKAHAFAQALAGAIGTEMTPRVQETVLPAGRFQNGWSGGLGGFRYSVTAERTVRLTGALNVGTRTGGTTIYNLPTNIRPQSEKHFVVSTGLNTTAVLAAYPNGNILVAALGGTETVVWFDDALFDIS